MNLTKKFENVVYTMNSGDKVFGDKSASKLSIDASNSLQNATTMSIKQQSRLSTVISSSLVKFSNQHEQDKQSIDLPIGNLSHKKYQS